MLTHPPRGPGTLLFYAIEPFQPLQGMSGMRKIPLKKPSSIRSDGKLAVSERDRPGCFGRLFGRTRRRYVASVSGSMLTGLKRASRGRGKQELVSYAIRTPEA